MNFLGLQSRLSNIPRWIQLIKDKKLRDEYIDYVLKPKIQPLLQKVGTEVKAQQQAKFEPARYLGRAMGAFKTPLTEQGLFPTSKQARYIPVRELLQKKSWMGGSAGKGLAQTYEDIIGATMPMMGAPAIGKTRFSPLAGAKTAAIFGGTSALLSKLKGEKIEPSSVGTAALFGFALGSFVPVKPQSVAKTELGWARKTLKVKPTASASQIRNAYYNLAKTSHPDMGGSNIKMKGVNKAFEILTSNNPPPVTAKWSVFTDWMSKFKDFLKTKPAKTGKELTLLDTLAKPKMPVVPVKQELGIAERLVGEGKVSQAEKARIAQRPVGKGRLGGLELRRSAVEILDEIASPKLGRQGKVLNPKELNVLGDYLRKTGGDELRGKVTKSKDVVFGTIKDRTFDGQTEYLVMAKEGANKGRFRLHSTPIGSKFFGTEIVEDVAQPPQDLVNNIMLALDRGDMGAAQNLYEYTSKEFEIKPLEDMKKEVEVAKEAQEKELAGFDVVKDKFGVYAGQVQKHMRLLRFAGEKQARGSKMLFREEIPRSEDRLSSDELADAVRMDENGYMAWIGEKAGVGGDVAKKLQPVVKARIQRQHKKAKQWFEKLDPKHYKVIRGLMPEKGTVPSYKRWGEQEIPAYVGAEATELTKERQAKKFAVDKARARKKEIAKLEKRPTPLSRVNSLVKRIREATEETAKANRIAPSQIRLIRALRSRLKIKNKELLFITNTFVNKSSLAKMTKDDAEQVIGFLQPQNWKEIETEVLATKKQILEEKVEKVIAEPFEAKDIELEERFGAIAEFNKTAKEIEGFASMIGRLPEFEPKEPTAMAALAPWMAESVGADLTGIRTTFHAPLRAITNIGRTLTNRMKSSLTKVFKDLTKEEAKQVVFIQAGMPRVKAGKLSEKVRQRASYLQEISKAHLKIINKVREARGLKPLKAKKRYIPYILDANISMATDLFDKHKFWEMRTKTFKEFQAGLFTHDPKRIIELWSRSAGDFLKKNLFGAFMLDRYQNLHKVNWQAATYGRMMVEMDIYNMSSDSERLLRSVGQAINKKVGSIYPKRIPVKEELVEAITNTTFGKELLADMKNGYINVPRIKLPNVTDAVHTVFYPAKLAWNFGFGLLNRQQPWAELPFIGVIPKMEGRLKMYSLIMPWNKTARGRYWKILKDGGFQHGKYASGEEVAWHNRTVNFVSDTTEAMNRLEGLIGAEKFMNQAEKQIGEKLNQSDKDKTMCAFSAFINFMAGKGWSPIKQRTTLGRLGYTFQQYSLNQINVYTEMYRISMKDDGAKKFWQKMAVDGGASQEAFDFFGKLSDTSKLNVYRVFLALTLPVAIIYALSRSWNVAQRAVPGRPRVSFLDLAMVVSDWMEDPERGKDSLVREIKNIYSVTSLKRLNDYMKARTHGIIQRGVSGRPMFVEEKDVRGTLVWGRTVLPEYEEQYPGWLSRLVGGKTEAGEIKKIKTERAKTYKEVADVAVRFMQEYGRAETAEEKKAIFYDYQEKGLLTEPVVKKIKTYYGEKAGGIGGQERSIKSMTVKDRASYILKRVSEIKKQNPKGVAAYLAKLKTQKILTSAVVKEMKRQSQSLLETLTPTQKPDFKEGIRELLGNMVK